MAKKDLHRDAIKQGLVSADSSEDDFTVADLEQMLDTAFHFSEVKSADKPIVAADGHVVLSQADIDARDQ